MRVIFQDPNFGVPSRLVRALPAFFDSHVVSAFTGWSAIVVELAIALTMVAPRRFRGLGLVLSCLLHTMIVVLMGLFSFGLVMIGIVAVASGGGADTHQRAARPIPADVPETDGDEVASADRHRTFPARGGA